MDHSIRSAIPHRTNALPHLTWTGYRTAAGSGVEDLIDTFDDGTLTSPREVDPPIGVLPDVIALDHRLGLLIDHGLPARS
jgi:hypothetical protein